MLAAPFTVLLIQAAVAGPVLPTPRPRREPAPCPAGADGDVVVCAPDQARYRLGPPPRAAADGGLPPARVRLSERAGLSGEVEGAGVGDHPSNRAMLRLKVGL